MSLDLTGLSAYTDEQKMPLIRKAILGGKTLGLISLQPDIKSSAAINILEGSAVFQAGACGFNASGTTTLTQRVLSVAKIKQNEAICVDDLEAFYTQTMMKAGSYNEEIPFAQLYAEEKAARSAKAIEKLVWQGDTGGSGNLKMTDGLIKLIDAESAVVTGTSKALDAANIIDAVDEMYAAIPEDVLEAEDLHLFMPMESYRVYTKAIRDANLYHYDATDGNFEIMIPGTNVKAIGVPGLNGTDRIFLCEASNLFAGTDLLNEQEEFKIFYADEADEVRVINKFKLGFNVAFPERIVSN